MPHYTHRGRSSSSSSASSHSPAPKHRSRSPRNSSAGHKSSSAPLRRDADTRRRSRSYSPRHRHSPLSRRSPSRQEMRRHNTFHSSRRSPSPRRRSSPSRRRSRSKSQEYRTSRSPGRRRSPSPRSRYHGSSPSRSRRSPPRGRSPTHDSSTRQTEPQRDQSEQSRSYPTPTGGSSSTAHQEVPAVAPAVVQEQAPAPTPHVVEQELPHQEWIPGLDIEPEPLHSAASSTTAVLHSSKPEPARREESREKPMEGNSNYSHEQSRDQPRNSRDMRDSRDAHASRDAPRDSRDLREAPQESQDPRRDQRDTSRDLRDAPRDSRNNPRDPRDAQRDSYRSSRQESDDRRLHDGRGRSRSPQYSNPRVQRHSSQSPVGRRLEAERDYNWVHTSRSDPNRSRAPTAPVRVSVNLPASPGDMDLRRDRNSTAPWEKKRQDQENFRTQREAERQHAESRREPDQRTRNESVTKPSADTYFQPSLATTATARGSLSNRFGTGTVNAEPFFPTENITVGIQRNLKDGDDRIPVKHHFVEAEVAVPRRKGEGETPLSLREEFITRVEEEVEERRIVKVEAQKPSRETHRENFEVRRGHTSKPQQSLSDRWKERDSRRVEDSHSSHHRETSREGREDRKENYRSQDDARYVDSARDERNVRHRSREDDRRRSPPRDERRVSDMREERRVSDLRDERRLSDARDERRVSDMRDERRVSDLRDERRVSDSSRSRSQRHESESQHMDDSSWDRKRGRYEIDPGDLRHNLATKRNRSYDEKDGRDVRSRIGERDDSRGHRTTGVEDFSKREDKYAYEEWKDKPEMIPKGSSYYEHDNRDTYTPRASTRGWGTRPFRARGGTFRGRGGRGFAPWRGRGTYRGFGFRGRPFTRGYNRGFTNNWRPKGVDGEREWKHDKFKEIHEDSKDNKDERPTSTTEK